ncbi:MAG: DUF4332 domain-containing protein [Gloeobacteraceae cyanobacterium ES-bin-144]|nr:DUF4332 domain-containing protein [Verrucomicrobiales bacterium]
MAEIISISGIGKASLELLEAAGFQDVDSIAKAGVDELANELKKANSILKISKRSPGRAQVEKWIHAARELVGVKDEPAGPVMMPVNYELSTQVISMLASAPFAIPLPASVLKENQVGVADIPAGILLNRYSGDLDVRIAQTIPKGKQSASSNTSNNVQIAENDKSRLEIDQSKIRMIGETGKIIFKNATCEPSQENDRVALIRGPRVSTNKGRNPNSPWYIRGVLHSHPISIYIGAIVTLLLMIIVPAFLLAAPLLLLSDQNPEKFSWVPKWFLIFPLLFPLSGIAYVIWGMNGTCRICNQRLFMRRSHLKHPKAHHVSGMGYIAPLCFHILTFSWFRCTHCGTPVRLKE